MKLVFRRYVERELDRDAGWYEERQPGLREDFLEEVGATLFRIQDRRATFFRKSSLLEKGRCVPGAGLWERRQARLR